MPRTTGYIVTYKRSRGFGFIESASYPFQQYFFHIRKITNYPDNNLYQQLNQSLSDNIEPPIEVSFTPIKKEQGLEAIDIQAAEYERTQETFLKIKHFLQTLDFTIEGSEDNFSKYVSMKIISLFGRDPSLQSIAVERIVKSQKKWEKLILLAEEWEIARSALRKSRVIANQSDIIQFGQHLIQALGFEPLFSSYDIESTSPLYIQRIAPVTAPFEALDQIENWSFVFLPDSETFADLFHSRHRLLTYDRRNMKIVVLMDDSETTNIDPHSVALLSQVEILRSLVKFDKDSIFQQGRVIRAILPKSMLQPYDAGVSYNEKVYSGRRHERELILNSPSNFAVYGGRRIGKTWFLQDIVSKCQVPPYNEVYIPLYVSLQPARNSHDAVRLIQEAIEFRYDIDRYEDAYTFAVLRNRFIKLHQIHKKKVLLALDEVDRLIRAKEEGTEFFEELRSFQDTNPEVIKIIFAGFKELMKSFTRLKDNCTLGNWVRDNNFSLGCLSKEDLRDLVSRLKWIGVNYNLDDILNKVYELTSGHPYYAHTLCESISKIVVDQNIKNLRASHVDNYITEQFYKRVFQTFRKNLNPLQRLIGKIFVNIDNGFSDEAVLDQLAKREITITDVRLQDEMTILEACSVFCSREKKYFPVMQNINKAFFSTLIEEDLIIRVLIGENEDEDGDE